ncbi:MAG: hypothetical protein B6242_14035 [Anaerolineaceae bacterium 4572_78]|nr:MAG: hypothetical protein B6242_14035 [Anaerolineaceae bacterium 4572_78]
MRIPKYIIDKASTVAQTSNVKRGKVGAVIFTNNGEIVTFASNTVLFGNTKQFTLHAEKYCLAKLIKLNPKRFGKLNMFVTRFRACDQSLSIARPCEECRAILGFTDITVYYTNREGDIEKL